MAGKKTKLIGGGVLGLYLALGFLYLNYDDESFDENSPLAQTEIEKIAEEKLKQKQFEAPVVAHSHNVPLDFFDVRGKGSPKAPQSKGVLKLLSAKESKSGYKAYSMMNDKKFAKDLDKVLSQVGGLKKTGRQELTGRRGSANAHFNSGYAEGGSGGIGNMLGGLLGGGSGQTSQVKAKKRRSRIHPRHTNMAPAPTNLSSGNPSIVDNNWLAAIDNPQSTFSIDVDKASYSMIRSQLNRGRLPSIDEVRIEEMINYFDYDYKEPKAGQPYNMITGLMDCPWSEGDYLARIALKSKSVDFSKAPANNIVFLVDVSGSMGSYNKLPLVISSLKELAKNLRPIDRIGIVVYAGAAGTVLESTSAGDINKIYTALNRLRSGGSTAGGEGIMAAYDIAKKNFLKNGNNRVILATDGDFNVGVSSKEGLVKLIEKKRKSNIFLSVLGFGNGNYKDHQMEQLADKGNGNYAYIDGLGEAQKVLVKEMSGTLIATAKDVKVQVEFNPSEVESYRLIGYVNRKMANEDFDRDEVDAGELGASMNVTALYQIKPRNKNTKAKQSLKYQTKVLSEESGNGELLTVKIRHKEPKGMKSKLAIFPLHPKDVKEDRSLNWAASVAGFGMLLRKSEFAGDLSYDMVKRLAKTYKKGLNSKHGEFKEFLQLINRAENIGRSASLD